MAELIRMNGTIVRMDQAARQMVEQADGPPLLRLISVTFVRGRVENLDFQKVFASGQARVEFQTGPVYEMTVTSATRTSTGEGIYAPIRYDITLEETPESARQRTEAAIEAAMAAAEAAAEQAEFDPAPTNGTPAERPRAPAASGQTGFSVASTGAWATALKQLAAKRPDLAPQPEPEPPPPLTTAELAGIETVLVGLRVDALVEAFVRAKIVEREVVDYAFQRFLKARFVAEATPLVGAEVAERVYRDLMEKQGTAAKTAAPAPAPARPAPRP